MNNNIIKGLLGFCLFLLLLLLIEWQLGITDEQNVAKSSQVAENKDLNIELPQLNLEKKPLASYAKMVESPLFIQGRKPIMTENEVQEEVISKVDDLTLLGIYSIKEQKYALFYKKGKDSEYIKRLEGEDVNGWQLIEIKTDSVVVEQHGNSETLMLRKPKPKVLKPQVLKRPRSILPRRKTKLNPEK